VPDGETMAAKLRDPLLRNQALNELLKVTASHESNYSLDGDAILKEFAAIVYEALDWTPPDSNEAPIFKSQNAWLEHTTEATRDWAAHCERKLARKSVEPENIKPLEAVLVIIRNLSFVASNLRLLAYSSEVLAILVGSLYESTSNSNLRSGDESNVNSSIASTIALPALHTLVNLAPYLDVTGQKLFSDKLFLSAKGRSGEEFPLVPNPSEFGQAADGSWGFGGLWLAKRLDTKEDAVQDVSKEMLLQLTQEHLVRVWSIFPGLGKVLIDSKSPRLVLIMAVDLLQEFINHARVGVVGKVEDKDTELPNARAILVHMPTGVLERLMDLLYVPRLGPDSLDYLDPVNNIVTRVTTLKLLMGYDATVDTDVRDRALDVLVPLLELDSPRLARCLGVKENKRVRNRLYDALFPILTTQVGRNEAPLLASQLLRELSKANENRIGRLYLQNRLAALASKDPRVAHLTFNHMCITEEIEIGEKEE
jgi:hypothetical protein